MRTASGLPVILATVEVASERIEDVSTPSRFTFVERFKQGILDFLRLISVAVWWEFRIGIKEKKKKTLVHKSFFKPLSLWSFIHSVKYWLVFWIFKRPNSVNPKQKKENINLGVPFPE